MKNKKLYRSCDNRMVGGVAGGLGEYFEIDPILVRLVFLLLIISGGVGLLLYIIAWIIIPNDPKCDDKKVEDEMKEKVDQVAKDVKTVTDKGKNDPTTFALIGGLFLIVFGVVLLFQNLMGFDLWNNFWPVLLIIVGIVILYKSQDKRKQGK